MGKPNVNVVVGGYKNDYPREYKTVVLKGNLPFASQVVEPDTKYVIKHGFDIGGGLNNIDLTSTSSHSIGGVTYYYVPFVGDGRTYKLLQNELVFIDVQWNVLSARELTPAKGTTFMIGSTARRLFNDSYTVNAVTIPNNCVLEFDGGRISNGVISCNNTTIVNPSNSFCMEHVDIRGTINNDHIVGDWFIEDPNYADIGINEAIRASFFTDVSEVRLKRYKYSITSPIYLYSKSRLIGRDGEIRTPSNGLTYGYMISVTYIFVRANVDGIIITPKDPPVGFASDNEAVYDISTKLSICSVAIKNIFLNYNTNSNSQIINSNNNIKENYGIHVCNKYTDSEGIPYPVIFRNSDFKNVGVNNFKYGIFIENRMYYPSGSAWWNKVICTNNHIGMVIKGNGKDAHPNASGAYTNGVWSNCFTFESCIFANNYLGGFYVQDVYQCELMKFNGCVLEGNGLNYNPAMLWDENGNIINTYHHKLDEQNLGAYSVRCKGITNSSDGLANNGQLIFDNCYIEWNYFRRLGTNPIEGLEEAYSGNGANYVSPKNVMKNSYTIQSDRVPIVVTKSRLSFIIKIAYIHGARYWEKDNFVRFEILTAPSFYPAKFEKDDYLVYYKTFSSGWFSDLYIEETFDYLKSEAQTLFKYIKQYVITNRVLSLTKCINNDCLPDIHIKVPNEPELNIRENDFEGELWLNKDKAIRITGVCTYFSEGFDISDLDRLCHLTTDKNEDAFFKVFLKKSGDDGKGHDYVYLMHNPHVKMPEDPDNPEEVKFVEYSHMHGFHIIPHNFPADYITGYDNGNPIISYPVIKHNRYVNIGTDESPIWITNEPKTIYNNLMIDHFKFVMETAEGSHVLTPAINVINGNLVEFNDCIIDFGEGNYPLVTTNKDNLVIRFNNCTLMMTDTTSYGDRPKITDNPRNVVEYNDCTADGVTLLSYEKSGTFANRPAFDNTLCAGFEYFRTDGKYMIYYGGDGKWYNAAGNEVTT